jgi:N utilization substance protein B
MGKRSQGRELAILALFSQFVCESESAVWKDTLDFIQAELFPVPEESDSEPVEEAVKDPQAGESAASNPEDQGVALVPTRSSVPDDDDMESDENSPPVKPDESLEQDSEAVEDQELTNLRESLEFASVLCEAVCQKVLILDPLIQKHLQKWDLKRIGIMEKTILRLAAYELLESLELAPEVIIAEAVKLSLEYCQENSHKFINGVLASLLLEVRRKESSQTHVFDFGTYDEE